MPFSPFRTGIPLVDRNLDAIAAALNPLLALGLGGPPRWVDMQLESGITSNPYNTDASPQYNKDALGVVWTKGGLYNPTGSTIVAGSTIFTLPPGMRPLQRRSFLIRQTNATSQVFPVDIEPDGRVSLLTDFTAGQFLGLSLCFQAEQ